MASVSVQEDDFDIGEEIQKLRNGRTDVGAVVTFTGTVRDVGGTLQSMTLEHYPGMTEAELERISLEAEQRWPLQGSRVIHRYGTLEPGDNIVLVVTLSKHRHAAFDAAMFLMDFLKSNAPFWKKEQTGETASWVDARETDETALKRWQD
ncbi:MAG: molybdenum cofactor biosynthesis protein MoaE [Kordiimonadaceae bacterium]|nr:molybdenum cofactor biosynthesis protein MoaE [Kordiimonadaceae bacterium]MBO6569137.1 molybdenum cofactor biosynthesis protein MoaE [Kordiimonadaceae bacterium]MBO6964613.1 molybdenum cofactor biosynthesis protein MoaE [Kordiimonadaceae bacterium]